MGTAVSDVILNYGMTAINDTRLYAEMNENPAAFLRKMSVWLNMAVPRFVRPPEVKTWLAYEQPSYADYYYTATEETTSLTVETGLTGFEMCSVGLIGTVNNNPYYTPITGTYDGETGYVTISGVTISAGQEIQIDFYTDGAFTYDLTSDMLRILGLCLQYVWESRYANDWLMMTPKINDKSFSTKGTEANQIKADTERMAFLKAQLDAEQRAWEQSLAYQEAVPPTQKMIFPG